MREKRADKKCITCNIYTIQEKTKHGWACSICGTVQPKRIKKAVRVLAFLFLSFGLLLSNCYVGSSNCYAGSKISTPFNNFARGKLDHDLNGRYDLPIYSTGTDIFQNFFTNFKGNAFYRPGFENILKFQDCRFVEFKFSDTQDYLALFYNGHIKFLSYDEDGNIGLVQSGGADLDVTSPYTLADCKELSYDQNSDVMYIVHNDYAPRKLTRTSATTFTLATFTRTSDPFDDPASGSVGWPACVRFYKGRLWYAGPSLKKTYVYGSVAGLYDDFTVPSSDVEDDDAVIFCVADLAEQIKWISGGSNSLILGSSQALVAVNGGTVDDPITPTTVEATTTNTDGAEGTQPVKKDVFLFYINSLKRNVNYFSYDLLTESFKSDDTNTVSFDITKGGIGKLVYLKNRNDFIFTLRSDGVLLALNFNQPEKIVGWTELPTDGTVLDIAKMYNPNTEQDDVFILVERDNGVFVERLANEVEFPQKEEFFSDEKSETTDKEAYWRYVAEKMKDCIYLDNSVIYKDLYDSTITFNGTDTVTSTESDFASTDVGRQIHYKTATGAEKGIFEITAYTSATEVKVNVLTTPTINTYSSWYKSFSTVSGLTDYASMEVSVVGDGGYLGEYTVSAAGVLTLDREITVACIGIKYTGLIKTFNLGFSTQGINTQVLPKNFNKIVLRFIASAGGMVGTSLYSMQDIQQFDPSGYYDLPPLPMDGDSREIIFNDTFSDEKYLYIKQDKPLPLHITAVFCNVNYGTSQ